ncbi:hypothetical protein I4U23_005169 [Adineta vaga]|nr:hypothetical protein I4U23_005169 [Adineta vaga]
MIITPILLIISIYLIATSNSTNQQNIFKKENLSSMCFNEIYKIPLMSQRFFRIPLNRTLLIQERILSINLFITTDSQEILQFRNGINMVKRKIDLTNNYSSNSIHINIEARHLNRTFIRYSMQMISFNHTINYVNCSVPVLILPPDRLSTKFYLTSIPFIIIFVSIQMGILLDLEVLKEIVRRPIAVAIGFFCQYGLMPIIAFAITKIFHYPPLYGFGLFVVGCCPGGSASNQLTVIFDGDLNLSVLMSFASTLASFVIMPLWLYTLGTHAYLRHLKMHIPFRGLMKSLATIVVPLCIGMIIAYFLPKIKPFFKRIVKPVLILLMIYFFSFGTYVNFYLFKYIDLRMALTTPLLPWFGYLLGGAVAWMFGQDWIRIKTIGIETGIQNVGIAFMVLLNSLPEPENNQATVIAIIISYLSSQPFYAILLINFIRKRCCKKQLPDTQPTKTVNINLENSIDNNFECLTKCNEITTIPVSLMGNSREL